MPWMACGYYWTCILLKSAFLGPCPNWLIWGFVMHCIPVHEKLLFLGQLFLIDHPRVCVCYFVNLLIKIWEVLLYLLQAVTTRRMSHHADVFEAWIFYIFVPHPKCMVLHSLVVWNTDSWFGIFIIVWVHNQDRYAEVSTLIDKWQHRSNLQIFIDARRTGPNPGSHSSSSLN